LNPHYAHPYYNRGLVEAKLENYQAAMQDFSKSLEFEPQDPDAYYERGSAKSSTNDPQ